MFLHIDGQSVNLDNVEVSNLGQDICTFELVNGDRVQMRIGEKDLLDKMGGSVFVYAGRAIFLKNITHARFSETMASIYLTSGRRETIRGASCVDNFIELSVNHLLDEVSKAAGEIEEVLLNEEPAPVVAVEASEQEGRVLFETAPPRRRKAK